MKAPEEHLENKLQVLRLLRDNFRHREVTGTRLGLDLEVVEASTGLRQSELQAILGELIAINLAAPESSISRPIAVRDGRAEITSEGLSYLHHVESNRAHEVFRAKVGQKIAAEERAAIQQETHQANLHPHQSKLGPAGFRPSG